MYDRISFFFWNANINFWVAGKNYGRSGNRKHTYIFFGLMVLICFANIHKHVHVENQATAPHIFHLEQLSASSGVQEYRGMYSLFNVEVSLMRVCMCLCVCV